MRPRSTSSESETSTSSRRSTTQAYPETWFAPRLLATGRYVGIRRDGRLVCVAGVHVSFPAVARRGPRQRRDAPRLARAGSRASACAALCRLLLEDGITTIALNVGRTITAAIRAYTRLGFEPVAEYTEAALVARG